MIQWGRVRSWDFLFFIFIFVFNCIFCAKQQPLQMKIYLSDSGRSAHRWESTSNFYLRTFSLISPLPVYLSDSCYLGSETLLLWVKLQTCLNSVGIISGDVSTQLDKICNFFRHFTFWKTVVLNHQKFLLFFFVTNFLWPIF